MKWSQSVGVHFASIQYDRVMVCCAIVIGSVASSKLFTLKMTLFTEEEESFVYLNFKPTQT